MKPPEQRDNEEVAKIIKDLEQRISDLEESNKGTDSTNPLLSLDDEVAVGDSVDSVVSHDFDTARWGERGWGISTWGGA